MSKRTKENNANTELCRRIEKIEDVLWGESGADGMVTQISNMNVKLDQLVKEKQDRQKTVTLDSRDWRLLLFSISSSVAALIVIEVISYVVMHLH